MGYYIMGTHTSRSWHPTKEEAEAEVKRLLNSGQWSHTIPYVEPDRDEEKGE